MRDFLKVLIAIGLCAGCPQAAVAQAYPVKPIRMVVPYPAGGSGDLVARLVATLQTMVLHWSSKRRRGQPQVPQRLRVGHFTIGSVAPDWQCSVSWPRRMRWWLRADLNQPCGSLIFQAFLHFRVVAHPQPLLQNSSYISRLPRPKMQASRPLSLQTQRLFVLVQIGVHFGPQPNPPLQRLRLRPQNAIIGAAPRGRRDLVCVG